MKKLIKTVVSIIIVLTFCLGILVGCGNSNSPVGTWQLTAAAINGESVDVADIGYIEMKLNADGTAILNADGEYAESTWSSNGNTLTVDGETYMFDGDVITSNLSNSDTSIYMKFIRA